jgi:hypothetical protein
MLLFMYSLGDVGCAATDEEGSVEVEDWHKEDDVEELLQLLTMLLAVCWLLFVLLGVGTEA